MVSTGDESAPAPRHLIGRFVLDLERGCLLLDGREITLRPKTFAVLRYLAERPGRLISKDELVAAIWPKLVVTDDTLVQSIGELRRALGEDGAQLITTVPRRGYRLENSGAVKRALRWHWKYGIAALLALLFAAGLLWLGARARIEARGEASPDARPAIAVLPFKNQSDEPARDYLADGLTQDIIYSLGRFSRLTVMSWNAVANYKGAAARPGEIARGLQVRYQVEGSVRFSAERMRVSAQLVDAQGRVLWSARFDEAQSDVFALQDRITREIAGALAIRVTEFEQQRIAAKPTSSFDAYDCVLRARPALQRPTRAGIVEARALLRRAIELDPGYAAAHSALGETFHVAISMGWAESPDDYWDNVTSDAGDALKLDESDVRARILLGRRYIAYNQYAEAQAQIDRAIAINPNDADALGGRGNILVWLGKTDAAIESLELAHRIDPRLNAFDRFALSLAYYLKKRYDASIEEAEMNLREDSDAHFNRALLAAAYAQSGRPDEAARVVETIRRTDPTFDAEKYGNKFLNPDDLAELRVGLRKAGLYATLPR